MHVADIVIVGTGKVAKALYKAFSPCTSVAMTSSRTPDLDLCRHAQFVLLCVADDAITGVASTIEHVDGIIAHTSGSIAIDALSGCEAAGHGVFYPLQTFSTGRDVTLREVPFFIEATNSATYDALCHWASLLTPRVFAADSALRSKLHLAAVFACNFANAMWAVADALCSQAGIPFEVMAPLLHETLEKAVAIGPINAQTGPAVRGDLSVIERHMQSLPSNLAKIYNDITQLIYEQNRLRSK